MEGSEFRTLSETQMDRVSLQKIEEKEKKHKKT